MPSPKVASRVLKLERKNDFLGDSHQFLKFLKFAFQQRRKFLIKNVSSQLGAGSVEGLRSFLQGLGHDSSVRAERLSVADFQQLFLFFMEQRSKG